MNTPNMTPEQRAQLKIQREMNKRTTQSIFDGRGQLQHNVAQDLSDGHTYLGEYLDLSTIPFAPDPNGSDHCIRLARLVEYMCTLTTPFGGLDGPLDKFDSKVLYAVSMLYATGLAQGTAGYEARSAATADQYLRAGGGAGTYWGSQEVREETCRLIFKHTDEREVAIDRRLQIFEDAVRLEMARFMINTPEGLALLKLNWKPPHEQFWCGWATNEDNARAHMISCGWR